MMLFLLLASTVDAHFLGIAQTSVFRFSPCLRNMEEHTITEALDICYGKSPMLASSESWLTQEARERLSNEDENFTLFHPTTRAIYSFFRWFQKHGRPLSQDYLENILSLHLLNKTVFSKDFVEGANIMTTMMNSSTFSNLNSDGQRINVIVPRPPQKGVEVSFGIPGWPKTTANIVMADIKCKNGVVHFIDKVMWFPRFASHTLMDGSSEAFLSAVSSAALQGTMDTLSNFTVFVPQNEVLERLLGNADVDPAKIKDVLLTHMARGSYVSPCLSDNDKIKMLNGKTVQVHAEDHTITIGGAKVIVANVLLRNGVMHIIDGILRPT